ncbi:MAG TPA: hemerythrin domain-containing protein [Streptosporangiaceae bacterium]|nr:hemerythrin domain-containing protein [Streptosporangiaceae bacterium]
MAEPARTGSSRIVVPRSGPPADICELVMADHRRIRRLSAALDDAARWDGGSALAHAWLRLANLLEAHAAAEEEICYLPMSRYRPDGAEDRRAAIADHDDIREAIREAALHEPGSGPWRRAVRAALACNADHIDREEHGLLTESLAGLSIAQRRQLGRQWRAFVAARRRDATSRD